MTTPATRETPVAKLSDAELRERFEKIKPQHVPKLSSLEIRSYSVSACRFRLLDGEGRELALLGRTEDGQHALALFRPDHDRAAAEFMIDGSQPILRLNRSDSRARLYIGLGRDNEPVVMFVDRRGTIRMFLVLDRGWPRLMTLPPGARGMHTVVASPFSDQRPSERQWTALLDAARAGKRAAFERRALALGFLSTDLDKLWTMAGRKGRPKANRRPAKRMGKAVAS